MGLKKALEAIKGLAEEGLIKDYAICGGIATFAWTETFLTRDLDVLVVLPEANKGTVALTSVYEYLKKRYDKWEGRWLIIEGIPVDIFPADDLGKFAIQDAKEIDYEGIKIKVLTPEYLIAFALKAGRPRDIAKIEMLLKQAPVDRDKLDKILTKYALKEKFTKKFGSLSWGMERS